MSAVRNDQLVADRYRLGPLLATGGMGRVYQAHDEVLGRPVAVKILRADLGDSAEFRDRFRAEARAAAGISNPHVVNVHDYGEQQTPEGTFLSFLVMELVPGRSVAEELAQRGQLPAAEVLDIVAQTTAGLASAHAGGLVHRDIKPANLLLTPTGLLKITDFGIARAADAVPLTRTGMMVGTAQYLSPEQASGDPATAASDFYSLGIVAYACLTGAPPFTDRSDVSIALAHVQEQPASLPPDVPSDVRDLVMGLLAKDPADRPASAHEVAAAATRLAGGEPTVAVPARAAYPSEPDQTRVLPIADVMDAPRSPLRRRAAPAVAGVAALVAVVTLVVLAASSGGASTARVPSLVGSDLAAAQATLTHDGLHPVVRRVDVAHGKAGTVVEETPTVGARVDHGSVVTLTVATGYVAVNSAAYVGNTYQHAAAALAALGLVMHEQSQPGPQPAGSVVAVSPTGRVREGSAVRVTVATAPAPAPAPKPGPAKPPKHGPHH